MKKNSTFALIVFSSILFSFSACTIFDEKEESFTKTSEEKIETLYGEIFPFSVSIATNATHRLEKDNKMVSLLASNIVKLEEFEGRKVEIDGVFKKEKMRPVFWVEGIRVKDLKTNSINSKKRFENKRYSFVIPESWEGSVLSDGAVHFLDKKDVQRKVFLTFEVKELTELDKKGDPNIVIANMAGNKSSSKFDSGQIRQEIALFSNLFENKKYVFIFNNNSSNFSRKKDFFKLLNSFIEGEENVLEVRDKELKDLAKKELELVKKEEKLDYKKTKDVNEVSEENTDESIISRIFGGEEKSNDSQEEKIQENIQEINLSKEFDNKIDNRSFFYESPYYNFSMSVPYGLWFKNFGPTAKFLVQIGFAEHELDSKTNSQFFLNIIEDAKPVIELQEIQDSGNLVIQFPRNNNSYYELSGSILHRDYMKSIQSTIKTW